MALLELLRKAELEEDIDFLRVYVTIDDVWWVSSFLRCPGSPVAHP
jgi:hypothetical protein